MSFVAFDKMMANTNETVNVFYNGKKLGYKNFEKYIDLYIGNRKETTRVYDSNKRWSVCVCHSDEGYRCVSFVNGISTTNGGTHVDYVTRQVVNKVIEKATQKNSSTQIKPNFVKEHMFIFVKATLVNPAFNSQTKTECTSKVQSFGSKYDCSEDFTKKLLKLGILEEAMALAKHKELRELNKSDGKKRQTLKGIPKLDDANKAGSSEGHKCELMLLEGAGRHHCGPKYCTRTDKNGNEYCRFQKYFDVRDPNVSHFYAEALGDTGALQWNYYQERGKDPLMNSVMPLQVQAYQSNCDCRLICDVLGASMYATKAANYASKTEKQVVSGVKAPTAFLDKSHQSKLASPSPQACAASWAPKWTTRAMMPRCISLSRKPCTTSRIATWVKWSSPRSTTGYQPSCARAASCT